MTRIRATLNVNNPDVLSMGKCTDNGYLMGRTAKTYTVKTPQGIGQVLVSYKTIVAVVFEYIVDGYVTARYKYVDNEWAAQCGGSITTKRHISRFYDGEYIENIRRMCIDEMYATDENKVLWHWAFMNSESNGMSLAVAEEILSAVHIEDMNAQYSTYMKLYLSNAFARERAWKKHERDYYNTLKN